MATETLKFKLELYSTYWNDNVPSAEILINDVPVYKDFIKGTKEKPDVIKFEYACDEGKDYKLTINRQNKGKNDTVINEKGDILHDQLLNIKYMEIDEIDIGTLVFQGVYTPEYAEPWATQQREAGVDLPKTLKNVTQMGHNGTWSLGFSSPFYIWLLENLY
jgi:hypothetical protein